MEYFDVIVIGAGISGLSLSRIISDDNKSSVAIVEKSKKPGGLVKCDRINDVLFHRVGGHVFNSRNNKVLDWFWNVFDKDNDFIQAKRNAKILYEDMFINYPIENSIYKFDNETVKDIVKDITQIQGKSEEKENNFESFLINKFGSTLYNLYFKPYNEKIWNTPLNVVPLEWLEGKLPMPNHLDILVNNILRAEEDKMVHNTFYYPKNNGSQHLVDTLSKNIPIYLNSEVIKIEYIENRWIINGGFSAKSIVYTGDVRVLSNILSISDTDITDSLQKVENLKSNGTSNLLCEIDNSDLSWLYIPTPEIKAHRIIYTGNFSPSNNGKNGKSTCTIEFSGKLEYQDMVDEVSKLPGNINVLSMNYEKNSYVIQDYDTRTNIQDIKDICERKNFYLLGRFAEWEYYNMDKAMESAMSLYEEKICNNKKRD